MRLEQITFSIVVEVDFSFVSPFGFQIFEPPANTLPGMICE
jgi:hypothetical protein